MGKSYSIDIRERVVARVEAGHSRREAAVRYDVSASFAVKLLSRRRAVLRQPGRAVRPEAGKLAPHLAFLVAQVEARRHDARACRHFGSRAWRARPPFFAVAGALRCWFFL